MIKRAITEFPVMYEDWNIVGKSHTAVSPSNRKTAIYNAECPYCSKVKQLSKSNMKQNKSCGCMRYKLNSRPTHGDARRSGKQRLYTIWLDMKRRCSNTPSSIKKYPYHAGKGIKVCSEWSNYESFKAWSKSNGYNDTLSIDRRDSDLNYEPSNCRWVDGYTQAQNQCMSKNNTSGYIGVTSKDGMFVARITNNGKRVYLGKFNTAEDAVIARNNYVINNKTEHRVQIVNQKD